ncbi:MAG: hypothetical protein QNK37_11940 [Acidobacteriota bacterium]|nr:hypothetical protein [Acidobacteriota bacterium]
MTEQPMQQTDYVQQRILEQESSVKSPVLAALLGFFFPLFGYLYVRQYLIAMMIFIGDILMILLSFFPLMLPFLLIYRIINSYHCHKASVKLNLQALKAAADERQRE